MTIRTKLKYNWIELIIEDGNTEIVYDISENELEDVKASLESVIQDIDYMIEQIKKQK